MMLVHDCEDTIDFSREKKSLLDLLNLLELIFMPLSLALRCCLAQRKINQMCCTMIKKNMFIHWASYKGQVNCTNLATQIKASVTIPNPLPHQQTCTSTQNFELSLIWTIRKTTNRIKIKIKSMVYPNSLRVFLRIKYDKDWE